MLDLEIREGSSKVEQRPFKALVLGSIPSLPTKKFQKTR